MNSSGQAASAVARVELARVESGSALPELSVVIPFFNEAPNVRPVLEEVRRALGGLGIRCEVLAVDDGSEDGTAMEIQTVARDWPDLQLIRFERNRGQAAALWRGFQIARGTWIAMLDGDGQNPPAELTRLWANRTCADMIVGVRVGRRDSWLRRRMSRVANAVRRIVLRDRVTDTGCSLKIFRRELVSSFLPIRTMYSFLPSFAVAAGWTVRELPVAHRARAAGVSKYGFRVMALHPLLDLLSLSWLLRRMIRQRRDSD